MDNLIHRIQAYQCTVAILPKCIACRPYQKVSGFYIKLMMNKITLLSMRRFIRHIILLYYSSKDTLNFEPDKPSEPNPLLLK